MLGLNNIVYDVSYEVRTYPVQVSLISSLITQCVDLFVSDRSRY